MQEANILRPISPIHIHVDDLTPVHVHVKKQKKSNAVAHSNKSDPAQGRRNRSTDVMSETVATPSSLATSVVRHSSSGKTRTRSRSPQHLGPWVPPPAKSTRGSRYVYQGLTQRLETSSPLRCDGDKDDSEDFDTEDDERVLARMREYERTIEALRNEIGTLKHEVAQCKTQKELEKRDDILKTSIKLLECKEQELKELKDSSDKAVASGSATNCMPKSERAALMKKLVEVEMYSKSVAAEFLRLREAIKKKRDSNILGHLQEQFLDKLSKFEASNRSLQRLLCDQREAEVSIVQLMEQRDLLEQRLTDTENMLQNLESQLGQERAESEQLQLMLIQSRDKLELDRDTMKKATRVQKERASQKDVALERANEEILEHQSIIREIHEELNRVKCENERLSRENKQGIEEVSQLNAQIREIERVFERSSIDSKRDHESTLAHLHEQMNDLTTCKMENDRLKTSLAVCEEKLAYTQKEMSRIQEVVHDYEDRMEKYSKEKKAHHRSVHGSLQCRLDELAPLPDLLRKTEVLLQEKTEEVETLKRYQAEYNRQIQDLQVQVHRQFEAEEQRRALLLKVTENEEVLRQVNMQLQELTRENVDLQRQLESAAAAEHQFIEAERQRSSAKDRAYRSQVLDLEAQINERRNEIARMKREKEEAERRLRSQLEEALGKLERCENTKRSLQNYIQFIQSSYATTFGDSIMTPPSARSLSSRCDTTHRSPFC